MAAAFLILGIAMAVAGPGGTDDASGPVIMIILGIALAAVSIWYLSGAENIAAMQILSNSNIPVVKP